MDINGKMKSDLGNDSKLKNAKNDVTGIRTSDLRKEGGDRKKKSTDSEKSNS